MYPADALAGPSTAVQYHRLDCGDLPVRAEATRFAGTTGVQEIHLFLTPNERRDFVPQLDELTRAYQGALQSLGVDEASALFRRLFLSDPVNQAPSLEGSPLASPASPCAVSCVGQPPANGAKVALWAYHLVDPAGPLDKSMRDATCIVHRNGVEHHWSAGIVRTDEPDSATQTRRLFDDYARHLSSHDMTLADHTLRTWLFVRDIDAHYGGMVDARRERFAEAGLTPDTHYIASSGIEAVTADPRAIVSLDAYAVRGLDAAAVTYLKAADHLCPTHIYGVTFERGTAVDWRDRRHTYISGTASIDDHGRILHEGHVARQLDRTLDNIDALLAEAGATAADMTGWIVYLRDLGDAPIIDAALRQRLGQTPILTVRAPVCRPGWLVEIEGMAITPTDRPALPPL
jgi:enamine deaminase RidA (YjgF/YER057c/UK114 family)